MWRKKKMKKLLFVILVCAVASAASAESKRLIGNGAWEDPSNWSPPGLPGLTDEARINWGGNTGTVSSAVPTVFRVYPGCDEGGTLDVQAGGAVTMTDCLMMAVGGNPNTGILNVAADATVSAGGHLWAAENPASVAILNIAGTLNIGGILGLGSVGFGNGGTATLNVLDGGVVNLGNIHGDGSSSIKGSSVLDICGSGLVTLPGDFVAVVQAYVAGGKITGNGIVGNVSVVFDGSQTLVTIPEPITISLLSLGALLLRKRS
jgi:hypothetical protein